MQNPNRTRLVRSRTFNETESEYYIGKKKISQLLQRILHLEENDSYKNDLLGYPEKSQEAAIIDGLLGKYSNDLFVEREDGFDLKKEDETEGSVFEVLSLIRRTLTMRREKPYELLKLRKKLLDVPYGLPPNVHAIFAAVAIKNERHRLEWLGNGKGNFEDFLCKAFSAQSSVRIRLQDFSRKQRKLLFILAGVLAVQRTPNASEQEFLKEVIQSLKNKINDFPETITKSPNLDERARNLVNSIEAVGKSTHDIVNDLIEISSFEQDWRTDKEASLFTITKTNLTDVLGQFDKLANARLFTIKEVLEELIPKENQERDVLFVRFKEHNNVKLQQITDLLKDGVPADKEIEALVYLVMEKPYVDCSDIEIGQVTERLRGYFERGSLKPEIDPDPGNIRGGYGHTPKRPDFNGSTKADESSGDGEQLSTAEIGVIVSKLQEVVDQEEKKYEKAIIREAIVKFYQSSIR